MAHIILRIYHEHGNQIHTDLVDLIGGDPRWIATVVMRLRKHGFIYKQDRACKYDTGEDKTQWIYGLKPSSHYEVKRRTPAERTKRYRDSQKKLRANSIFTLGGIQL